MIYTEKIREYGKEMTLEEEISLIQKICESAESFAPEYDVEKIYEAMTSMED